MSQFTNVSIGTSDPVDLCNGLPLIPIGSIRAGFASSQHSDKIFDTGATVLFSRFKLSSYYDFLFGLCGPSVSFLLKDAVVTFSNASNQGSLTLDLTNSTQEMESGLFMGFTFGGGVHAIEQLYLPSSWYSPWKFSWHTVFDASIKVEIDFLELFADLIAYLLEQGAANANWSEDTANHLKPLAESVKTFEFSGETDDDLLKQHSLTATPTLTIPVNLVDYVPPLASFVKLLHKVKGDLCFGPTFTIGMPVTLSLGSFTTDKGLSTQATYGSLKYDANSITATGPTFPSTPKTLTTNVAYDVGFDLDLGVCFSLSACKVFNFNFQVSSLDLGGLLGFPSLTPNVTGNVATQLESSTASCVLVPELSLKFSQNPVPVGIAATGTVSVASPYVGPMTVTLTTDPSLPNFPVSVSIPTGKTSATFSYTFANRCVPSGDPDDSTATQSASPTSPNYTVNVTGTVTLSPAPTCGSSVISVTSAVNVTNRVISLALPPGGIGTPGPSPVWFDTSTGYTGGATINADPTLPAGDSNAGNLAIIYLAGAASAKPIPIKLRLLDETRQEVTTGKLLVLFQANNVSVTLGPTQTVSVAISSSANTLELVWISKGPHVNYSSRFILVVDAGCDYGQSEFWLDVWNWS